MLNCTLLLNEELKATMTTKESTAEYCSTYNIVTPNKFRPNNALYTFDIDLSTKDVIVPDAYIMNKVHFNLYIAKFGEEHYTMATNTD